MSSFSYKGLPSLIRVSISQSVLLKKPEYDTVFLFGGYGLKMTKCVIQKQQVKESVSR